MNRIIIIVLILILLLVLINILITVTSSEFIKDVSKCNIHKDGFIVIDNILSKEQIRHFSSLARNEKYKEIKHQIVNSKTINNKIKDLLGSDYVFMDYVWMIIKSHVHTCHRDNNGLFFNKNQKHDSYTILFYLEDMDSCLDVLPRSHLNKHKNVVNLSDYTKRVKCNPGSAVLFNANLVHTGSFNKKPHNMRIQMKISHQHDLEALNYYQNFNKYVDKDVNVPISVRKLQKHISCQFPILSDLTQETNIKTSRGSSDGTKIPLNQKIFSTIAYGSPNYYDLKDA